MTIGGNKGPGPDQALALVSSHTLLWRGALHDVKAALNQLGANFQDIEMRPAKERLRLARGWSPLSIANRRREEAEGRLKELHDQ